MVDDVRTVPIYMSGESHAGHYVPLMLEKLLFKPTSGVKWDARGAALGNAWIDPIHQYDVSRIAKMLWIISDAQLQSLQAKEKQCQRKLESRVYVSKLCWDLLDDVIKISRARTTGGLGLNQYDTRDNVKSSRFFPPGHEHVEAYMNQPDVRAAVHVDRESPRFKECADPPYDALQHQDGLGVVPSITRLLDGPADKRVRLLFYNGQSDLICNHVGVERALLNLNFQGKAAFHDAKARPWLKNGHVVGYHRSANNLGLLAVKDSGHMVPMDQPEAALNMIATFLDDAPFAGDAPPRPPPTCADACANPAARGGRHHRGGH